MTKIAAHDRALAFLKEKGSATPAQIEKHVGQGAYASKYVCYLKLRGYEIETVKTGRTVTEYKFISDGDSATRDYQWVPPAKRGQNKTATSNMKSARVKRDAKAVFEKAAKSKREEGPTKKEMLQELETLATFPVEGFMGATKESIQALISHLKTA